MKTRAILLSILLVGSLLVGPIALAGGAAAAPSGMVGVPDGNVGPVSSGPSTGPGPPGELPKLSAPGGTGPPTDAAAWDVMASAHAGDLDVAIGETASGGLALQVGDDVNHAGREIAVDATTLQEAVGRRPELAYGLHEDGSEWTSKVRYEGGYAILEVPEFSSNTITFDGTVTLIGTPAANATTYNYNRSTSDDPGNFTIDITGSEHRANTTTSGSNLADGDSLSVSVDGTKNPEAATVTLTGDAVQGWRNGPTNATHRIKDMASDSNTVYAVSTDNEVKAIHASNGTTKWTYNQFTNPVLAVAVDSGGVYAAGQDNEVHAIDKSDGSQLWTYTSPSDQIESLLVDSGTVYSGDDFNEVHAISTADGTQEWVSPQFGNDIETLAANSSHVFAGTTNNQVHAIDRTDGSNPWSYTKYGATVNDVEVDSGTVYSASDDNTVQAISTADGSNKWNYTQHSGAVNDIAVDSNGVYTASADNEVHAINRTDGSQQWTYTQHTINVGRIAVNSGTIYTGDSYGELHAVATADGSQQWTYTGLTDDIRAVDASSTEIFVGGDENVVDKVNWTTDPSVSIDGNTVSTSGDLSSQYSESITLSTGTHSASISTSNGFVSVNVEVEEITETVDPTISVNGNTTSYSGTLADGSTASLTTDPAWLRDGKNTVEVYVSEAYDGPTGQVEFDYSHSAVDDQTVSYGDEVFSERYTASKTFASDTENATLTIPFQGTVVKIRTLEQQRNGNGYSAITADNYTLDGTTLTVQLGSVTAGTKVEIDAVGSKVRPVDGSVSVLTASTTGTDLNTEIKFDSMGPDFRLEVNESEYGDNIYYTHTESWSGVQSHVRVEESGSQALHVPTAANGSTAKISNLDLKIGPAGGYADVRVTSAGAEPEFEFRDSTTADRVDVTWKNTETGVEYQLYDLLGERELDRETAQSPVTFSVSNPAGLSVVIYDLGAGGTGGTDGPIGPITEINDDTSPFILMGVVLLGLAGLVLISRGLGGGSSTATTQSTSRSWTPSIRGYSLPSISQPSLGTLGKTDPTTGRWIVLGGLVIITVVALDIASPGSLYRTLLAVLTITAGTMRELLTIFTGVAALIGLWLLDNRTTEAIPTWLKAIAAGITAIYLLETIQPGVLLGPVSEGFETISPLFWLALLGGGGYMIYGWIQSRRSPDTQVTFELGGDGK